TGFVRDYTLSQIKKLHIYADENPTQFIPTIEEVFDLLKTPLESGLRLNIELKNSVFPYEGMEEKIIGLAHQRGLQDRVVYSSFYAKSMVRVKELDAGAEIGILDRKVSDCLYKAKGVSAVLPEAASKKRPAAVHPHWQGMDLPAGHLNGITVRAWFTGHLYPEKPTGTKLDLDALEKQGITDVFLNEPEMY
ncbi:MAG: hypothetical protein NC489_20225, partial [Ruminococcus flavefaciens]|nr:hypothetical protein [Ruminococcus flavefaciens]